MANSEVFMRYLIRVASLIAALPPVAWFGNSISATFLVVLGCEGPRAAAYGTSALGCLWLSTTLGLIFLGMVTFGSDRKLHTRRHNIFRATFYIVLSIRFVCTVGWLCALAFISHTREQMFASLASLLDVLIIGQLGLIMTINSVSDTKRAHLSPPRVEHASPQTADHISDTKAAAVIQARKRKYGSCTTSTVTSEYVGDGPTEDIIYASRESHDPLTVLQPGSELSAEEYQELQRFPGFLRCACCIVMASPQTSYAFEHIRDRERLQNRRMFLCKPPVGTVFDYDPPVFNYDPLGEGADVSVDVHKLCRVCERLCTQILRHQAAVRHRNIVERMLRPKQDVCCLPHHDDPVALNDSSSACHLCALIWACLNESQQGFLLRGDEELCEEFRHNTSDDAINEIRRRRSIRIVILEDSMVPHFGNYKRPQRWEKIISGLRSTTAEIGSEFARPIYLAGPRHSEGMEFLSEKMKSGPLRLPVSTSSGSTAVIGLIAHVLNHRRNINSKLPTRVLDVRDLSCGRFYLRHVDQLGVDEQTSYIALSHCWGKTKMPRLLRGNINEYAQGVSIERLPKTFQEAMEVTHRLDVRYIWIDSLCIAQDDPADWEREAALMGYIYRNAFCTIAAVDSKDGLGGLFRTQYPKKSSPCLIGLENGVDPIYAVPYPQSEATTFRTDLALSTWNSRGWCLQERK